MNQAATVAGVILSGALAVWFLVKLWRGIDQYERGRD